MGARFVARGEAPPEPGDWRRSQSWVGTAAPERGKILRGNQAPGPALNAIPIRPQITDTRLCYIATLRLRSGQTRRINHRASIGSNVYQTKLSPYEEANLSSVPDLGLIRSARAARLARERDVSARRPETAWLVRRGGFRGLAGRFQRQNAYSGCPRRLGYT